MKTLLPFVFSFLLLIFSCSKSYGQNFADPSYYLIDSLELKKIGQNDLKLIDSSLITFHSTDVDTIKLQMLQNIVDNCWDVEIWPRYNDFLIDYSKRLLVTIKSKPETKKLVYFLAGGLSNRGFFYDQKGNLLEALNHYHKSLLLYEKIDNIEGTSTTFNNLGVIYSIVGDTSKALEYHRKSLESKKLLKDIKGVAMSFNNIGSIYENAKDPFKALNFYEKSLKLSTEIQDKRGIAMSYDNIGDIYLSEEVYGKAHQFYFKGLKIWTEMDIKVGISTAKNNIANVLMKMGNFEDAKPFALESYELAKELDYPMDIENSAKTLIAIYRHEGQHELALLYSDIYIEMRDMVRNEENANKAYKKSMQYEYQVESLQDSLQFSKEREVQKVKLKQQETQSFALLSGLLLSILALAIGLRSFMRKKKDNEKINTQKQEVEAQKQKIELQHLNLTNTHREISDSINYAKRIQAAILPTKEALAQVLVKEFVIFEPKDIVSGDFYWLEETENEILIAVADCTGHGVPGAMVSVVCHNALNRAVREFKLSSPAEILDKTKELVIETFKSKSEFVRDGMDISFCKLAKDTHSIEWAGANNPLYILRKGSHNIEIISPNKQSVGVSEYDEKFDNHLIDLKIGDRIYLFTDGYVDQFGGEHGKKFKHARFRELIIKYADEDILDQKDIFLKEFYDWKRQLEQVDDVCLIGIELE